MTNILLLTTTTTLLFLLSPHPISSYTTTTTATTVVDFFGNPIEAGSKYYLFFSGVGYFFGGLTMSSKPNNHHTNCPQYVSISPNPSDLGPGVELWPSDPTQKTISLSSDINIAFSGSTNFTEKPIWQLVEDENMKNGRCNSYIMAGGVIGNRSGNSSWFSIEKVDDRFSPVSLYKIRYCPNGGNNSSSVYEEGMCGYLGLKYDMLSNVTLCLDVQHEDPEVYFWPANLKPHLPTKGGLLWG